MKPVSAAPAPSAAAELDDLTLRRAQRGEPAAQRKLVARYERPVFALLARSGERWAVEDLAQETFLRVFQHLPRFEIAGPARLSTWIFTIALRVAKDLREKRARRRDLDESRVGHGALAPPTPASAERQLDTQAQAKRVQRALDALPEAQRVALVLQYYHHRSLDEIVALTDAGSVGTAKSRIARGRAALKRILLDDETTPARYDAKRTP